MDPLPTVLQDIAQVLGHDVRTVTSLTHGQSHEIYKIELPGGQTLCLCKPKTKEAAALSKRGNEVLRWLKEREPSLQAPAIIHEASGRYTQYFSTSMEIRSRSIKSCQRPQLEMFLKGPAAVLFKLWTVPVPAEPGTALSYFDRLRAEIDKGLCRSLENEKWATFSIAA